LKHKSFRVIKPEIRVLGVDDCPFIPHIKGQVPVIGVVFRGGYWLDGVLHTKIAVDGFDATEKIVSMITSSPHYKQLRVIMLNGVTFAGFNIVNIKTLNAATKLPVITVTREKPDLAKKSTKHSKTCPKAKNAGTQFSTRENHSRCPLEAGKRKSTHKSLESLEMTLKRFCG